MFGRSERAGIYVGDAEKSLWPKFLILNEHQTNQLNIPTLSQAPLFHPQMDLRLLAMGFKKDVASRKLQTGNELYARDGQHAHARQSLLASRL